MEQKFPGNREQSVFASVELSLRRLSAANRERARVLGVFYGAVDLDNLRVMMGWEKADVTSLAGELIETGLATPDPARAAQKTLLLLEMLRVASKDSSS